MTSRVDNQVVRVLTSVGSPARLLSFQRPFQPGGRYESGTEHPPSNPHRLQRKKANPGSRVVRVMTLPVPAGADCRAIWGGL